MTVLKAAFDSLQYITGEDITTREMMEDHIALIMGDAYEVAAKIKSS